MPSTRKNSATRRSEKPKPSLLSQLEALAVKLKVKIISLELNGEGGLALGRPEFLEALAERLNHEPGSCEDCDLAQRTGYGAGRLTGGT